MASRLVQISDPTDLFQAPIHVHQQHLCFPTHCHYFHGCYKALLYLSPWKNNQQLSIYPRVSKSMNASQIRIIEYSVPRYFLPHSFITYKTMNEYTCSINQFHPSYSLIPGCLECVRDGMILQAQARLDMHFEYGDCSGMSYLFFFIEF